MKPSVRRPRTRGGVRRVRGVRTRGGRGGQGGLPPVETVAGPSGLSRGRPGPRTTDDVRRSRTRGGVRRVRGVRTRGGRGGQGGLPPVETVAGPSGLSRGRPGPRTTDEFTKREAVAGPSHSSGTSQLQFAEREAVAGPSHSSGTSQLQFAERQHHHHRRYLQDEDLSTVLNYGSEEETSGDDDDDDEILFPPSALSRVVQAVLDTPLDLPLNLEDPTPADEPTNIDNVNTDDTEMPRDLFDFDWKPFPYPPIPPKRRRETFSNSNVGPTTLLDDPYDIFISIWDRSIMEHIVSETNKYAQEVATHMFNEGVLRPNSRIGRWVDTTVSELYTFFAVIMAMGVVIKSRVEEYWGTDEDMSETPCFRPHMSVDRFKLLCRCIHFNDNSDMCRLNMNTSEAKLYKLSPILSHLGTKFQELYIPNQNLSLDESLLMWKGCLDIVQLIPNKAAKKGIKTYEICESQTGYLWRFEVHAQKRSQQQPSLDPLAAHTPAIVLRLVKGLEYKGYTLWMDNFYNSPCLARHLKSLGFDVAGTLRTDRKLVPRALHALTKQNMRQGQISGLTSGDVDIMVWKDTNRVALISTYHGNAQSSSQGSIKPIMILDYNIMMGGVDKKDQLLSGYPIERKQTTVWYKKFFRRLLNVSVMNSYIIHRHNSPTPLKHRQFRKQLIRTILSKNSQPQSRRQPKQQDNMFLLEPGALTHRIGEYPFHGCQRIRRQCTKCKKRVHTYCVGCNKPVCIDPCFVNIHYE